jgi:hypothetical protein
MPEAVPTHEPLGAAVTAAAPCRLAVQSPCASEDEPEAKLAAGQILSETSHHPSRVSPRMTSLNRP